MQTLALLFYDTEQLQALTTNKYINVPIKHNANDLIFTYSHAMNLTGNTKRMQLSFIQHYLL